jgi:hypothetical protein
MKNKILNIFLLFFILHLIGCESDEDFLTENPKTFYTLENAFTSSSQVDQALISCYSQIRVLMIGSSAMNQALKGNGTDVLDVPERRISNTFADYSQLSPQTGLYNQIYSNLYQLISKANTALYGASLENIDWSSEEAKNYAIAQAKFFRAWGYRNLGELYGGVPIVDEIITSAKYDFERSTRIATYQFAIDDLESVLDYFPETTNQAGRIVKGAAQHYLSELYLALGTEMEDQGQNGAEKFTKAVQYASDVIDNDLYSLMKERFGTRVDREPGDVFWDLFQVGNVNYQDGNTESIWTYQVDFDAYSAEDVQSAINYPRDYMPALRVRAGFVGTDADVGGRGIAAVSPTWYMIEEIWDGELGNDIRNAEHNIQRNFKYNDPAHPQFGEVAPDEVIYADNDAGMTYPIWWKLSTDQFFDVPYGYPNSHLFRDEYAIRLPETILLRAEAFWRLGQNQQAANDINKLRERAQCEYLISPAEISLDFILDERARELFVEETRWNTLLRMGGTVAVDRIKEHNYWPNLKVQQTLNFNFNLWPIPQPVIDRNKDVVLPQNPGWANK